MPGVDPLDMPRTIGWVKENTRNNPPCPITSPSHHSSHHRPALFSAITMSLDWPLSGDPRVVVSTAAFHARVRGSFRSLGSMKETKMFLPHPLVKLSIVVSLRDREVACLASDLQGLNFESCVWRTVSSHHPQVVLLAQFSLYVHKSGLKPDSFLFKWPLLHYCRKVTKSNNLLLPHRDKIIVSIQLSLIGILFWQLP